MTPQDTDDFVAELVVYRYPYRLNPCHKPDLIFCLLLTPAWHHTTQYSGTV